MTHRKKIFNLWDKNYHHKVDPLFKSYQFMIYYPYKSNCLPSYPQFIYHTQVPITSRVKETSHKYSNSSHKWGLDNKSKYLCAGTQIFFEEIACAKTAEPRMTVSFTSSINLYSITIIYIDAGIKFLIVGFISDISIQPIYSLPGFQTHQTTVNGKLKN